MPPRRDKPRGVRRLPALAPVAASHILQIVSTLAVMAKMIKGVDMVLKQIDDALLQSKEKIHSQIQLEEESWKTQNTWHR